MSTSCSMPNSTGAPEVEQRLKEIEARAAKAKSGHWYVDVDQREGGGDQVCYVGDNGRHCTVAFIATPAELHCEDAFFIAHARADVPWLCAALRAALVELAATQKNRDGYKALWGEFADWAQGGEFDSGRWGGHNIVDMVRTELHEARKAAAEYLEAFKALEDGFAAALVELAAMKERRNDLQRERDINHDQAENLSAALQRRCAEVVSLEAELAAARAEATRLREALAHISESRCARQRAGQPTNCLQEWATSPDYWCDRCAAQAALASPAAEPPREKP